ncbi:hypothetical protein AB0G74_10200 [Streptomyces sp. NPDC020875]|uniref:hypothetical protein n=1 Tax=Streptomyces sp. NPDC020875 TaxID=3154898 RepID=UPI0033ED9DD6
MAEANEPEQLALRRYLLYVDTLRARMPEPQFRLLMEIVRLWAEQGGGTARLSLDDEERELFTAEVRQELLQLIGLIGAMRPGYEDRAEHVVARLGDGEHAKEVMSLVPPDVADDPDRLRDLRDRIDGRESGHQADRREVEGIAQVSGMAGDPDA